MRLRAFLVRLVRGGRRRRDARRRAAIILEAGRPGSGTPTEEYLTRLHDRLAAEPDDRAP
jgi:hypothetical protein